MPDLLGAWRPEGWVNPEDLPEDGPLDGLDGPGLYESGATALLEALKEGGELGWWHYNGCAHKWERHNDRKQNDGLACDCNLGHLIFIPEAQE